MREQVARLLKTQQIRVNFTDDFGQRHQAPFYRGWPRLSCLSLIATEQSRRSVKVPLFAGFRSLACTLARVYAVRATTFRDDGKSEPRHGITLAQGVAWVRRSILMISGRLKVESGIHSAAPNTSASGVDLIDKIFG